MKIQTFSIVAGTKVCNAKCPFCVSRMTPSDGIGLEELKVNWRNFHKACALAKQCGVTTVLITGKGEPTLYPDNITDYMKALHQHMFPLVELQTNGILLGEKNDEYEEYLKRWYELGLTTIAISIVSHEDRANQQIYMGGVGEQLTLPRYPPLAETIAFLHKKGFSVRLSCVLIRNVLGEAGQIRSLRNLVAFAKDSGVEQLTLRPLNKPDHCEDKAVEEYCRANMLTEDEYDALDYWLRQSGNRLMTLTHGATVYDVDGQNVCLTSSLTINPAGENLRQLIFFPDGHLRYDWQYEGAILL